MSVMTHTSTAVASLTIWSWIIHPDDALILFGAYDSLSAVVPRGHTKDLHWSKTLL